MKMVKATWGDDEDNTNAVMMVPSDFSDVQIEIKSRVALKKEMGFEGEDHPEIKDVSAEVVVWTEFIP